MAAVIIYVFWQPLFTRNLCVASQKKYYAALCVLSIDLLIIIFDFCICFFCYILSCGHVTCEVSGMFQKLLCGHVTFKVICVTFVAMSFVVMRPVDFLE